MYMYCMCRHPFIKKTTAQCALAVLRFANQRVRVTVQKIRSTNKPNAYDWLWLLLYV